MAKNKIDIVFEKGGTGSGHRGHSGRPGKRGGSLPGGSGGGSSLQPSPGGSSREQVVANLLDKFPTGKVKRDDKAKTTTLHYSSIYRGSELEEHLEEQGFKFSPDKSMMKLGSTFAYVQGGSLSTDYRPKVVVWNN